MLVEPKDIEITEKDKIIFYHSVLQNDYIKYKPYPKQALGLILASKDTKDVNSVLIGAGGYGGKTFLGSMCAAQFLEQPDYTCLVTRRNYAELLDTNSIWETLNDWCCNEDLPKDIRCDAIKSPSPRIIHPNGNTIYFKAFDNVDKKQKFKSASYDRIVNDEASELPNGLLQFQYRSMRNTTHLPLSIINLSNPGGDSTDYLVNNFVDGDKPYISLDWRDNPFIDKEAYSKTLDQLDYVDQKYQKYGDWFYKPARGDLISREDMKKQIYNEKIYDSDIRYSLIGIDMAGKGKDKFAICKYDLLNNGLEMVSDFAQTQSAQPESMLVKFVAKHNPSSYAPITSLIVIEQEGGSASLYAQRYFQELLKDFNIPIVLKSPKGSKYARARPLMNKITKGQVKLYYQCGCLDDFIDESTNLEPVPKKSPNLVDSCTLLHNYLHEVVFRSSGNVYIGNRIGNSRRF